MYKNKMIIALIPARGGSKGLPRKNIKELDGKPLIAHTIEVAKKSRIFDRIIVSTDNEEIAEVAKDYGAEVPFIRPMELATDTADAMDVVIHALKWFKNQGHDFDYVMKLQPTSPLRIEQDIINSMDLIIQKDGDSVISVSECDHHPFWSNTLGPDLKMNSFIKKEIRKKNRQDLPIYYRLNGAIFLSKTDKLITTKDWFGENSYAYIMDSKRAIDIDSEFDFDIATFLIKKRKT
ncbi:MAG: acylneuraminate cytidylyltransferase family protein [Promethearchaeota archaeon]